jgi:hypothetical protein
MLKPVENISKFKRDVIRAFENISRENPSLYKFLYEACYSQRVFIIGGFLRSVVNHQQPRDLDVMMNVSNELLEHYISSKHVVFCKNKFGGFKINFGKITVDIWTSDTNWAFASKVVSIGEHDILSRVAQGAFYNYDSLVFDLQSERVNVASYNNCVVSNILDIIRKDPVYSEKNPGKMENVLRAFNIRNKVGLQFSEQLCRYIHDQFCQLRLYDVNKIVDYLLKLIESKNSEKYKLLADRSVLYKEVHYVFHILNASQIEETRQLTLFESSIY